MSKENYMKTFNYSHELAFDTSHEKNTAGHGLHNDGGLPEEANGLGWYSSNRLSYKEWY